MKHPFATLIDRESSFSFTKLESRNKSSKRYIDSCKKSSIHSQKAGPGSYNLPSLLGCTIIDSNQNNFPSYSMGKEDKNTIKVIYKCQQTVNYGKHSPGVGKYNDSISLNNKHNLLA